MVVKESESNVHHQQASSSQHHLTHTHGPETFPSLADDKTPQHDSVNVASHRQTKHQRHEQRHDFHTTANQGRPNRVYSVLTSNHRKDEDGALWAPMRRFSNDFKATHAVKFHIIVADKLAELLKREDTDRNIQITIDDKGPKWIWLGTSTSDGYVKYEIRTTYHMSNLLQELYIAKALGQHVIDLPASRIQENPVDRLARLIKDVFWSTLTRQIDGGDEERIKKWGDDPKDRTGKPRRRIYVPTGAPEQFEYYTRVAREQKVDDESKRIDVRWLAQDPSDEEYVRDLNDAPGLLALEMEQVVNTPRGEKDFRGLKFVVPGGRFNELYGWDSYMESLGLILHDKVPLAKNMVKHFCFCIKHYGKILNANRTYYLCRTQPPFLTDMAWRVFEKIKKDTDAKEFLRTAILAAIKEYYNVWMSAPRYDPASGLSRYRAQGLGVPPETEASHFVNKLTPFAKKHNMSYEDFINAYNHGKVHEPELDLYFLHDRAIRESGHDTSYRLENVAADLAVVDLNSCLYKYEKDIARIIADVFDDQLVVPADWLAKHHLAASVEVSSVWNQRAALRRDIMTKLMWDEKRGMFFDYNTKDKIQTGYESVTTFWALWAGLATEKQAHVMVQRALPLFEVGGGLVSGTEKSRGDITLSRPNRQWDYPFGWAPQQILAWRGLEKYGFPQDAQRLAYKWCHMVTRSFVDFNGIVVEKYNVTDPKRPHIVAAEYGNQGSEFEGHPTEGFGWVNASYVIGLSMLDISMRRSLGALATWKEHINRKTPGHRASVVHVTEHGDNHAQVLQSNVQPPPPSTESARKHDGSMHAHGQDAPDAASQHAHAGPAKSAHVDPRYIVKAAAQTDGAGDEDWEAITLEGDTEVEVDFNEVKF